MILYVAPGAKYLGGTICHSLLFMRLVRGAVLLFSASPSCAIHVAVPPDIIPRVVHVWSLKRIQKSCLSVCLSVRPIRVTQWSPTYAQISFETATPMPRASGRNPRGGDCHGPNHISSAALCMELSELTSSIPIGLMGRAAAIARARAAEKLFKTIFKWNWVKIVFVLQQLCCKR